MGRLTPIQVFLPHTTEKISHVAYIPNTLPDDVSLSSRSYRMISEAERAIGRLDSVADHLPRPELLIRPALYKEAVSTSALEGTHAPLFVRVVRLIESEPLRFNLIRRLQNPELVDHLIGHPLITPARAAELHNVTYPPANNAIRKLVELGFLREVTGRSYGRIFACTEVMQIVDAE